MIFAVDVGGKREGRHEAAGALGGLANAEGVSARRHREGKGVPITYATHYQSSLWLFSLHQAD